MGEKPILVITGSSGRIGSKVIERFKDKYTIAGLDFVPPKSQVMGMTIFPWMLEVRRVLSKLFNT